MKIYHYNVDSGALLGESEARKNPAWSEDSPEEGEFLIPAHTTTIAPPPVGQQEVAVFEVDAWVVKADYREVQYYAKATGAPMSVSTVGALPDAAWTTLPKPSHDHAFDDQSGTWILDINKAKAAAKAGIDAKAEQVRAKYLTSAPLQSATYTEKAREAREFKAAGYPSAPFGPVTWPYVDAEMRAASDATPQAACDRILAEAAQYAQVKGAAIEYERRHGKITVDAAGTASAIATAEAAAHAALDAL